MGDSDTSRFSELSYRLRVRDFGPIAEADVTLRPLTVFVGPSNTGKSYLATLIYALHRCFVDRGSLPDPPDRSAPIPHVRDLRRLGEWAMGIAGAQDKRDLGGSTETALTTDEAPGLPDFPPNLDSLVRPFLEAAPGVGRSMESELQKYFGVVRTRDLVRQPHAQAAHIDVEIPRRGGEGAFGYDVTLSGDGLEAAGYIHGGSNYSTDQVDSDHTRSLYRHLLQLGRRWPSHPDLPAAIGLDDIVYVHYVGQLLTETIRSWMLRPLGAFRAHYLPSDRAGLLHSRDVVLSSLLHRATSAGAKPDALLSGLSADFLEQLIRLSGNGGDEDPTNALLARRLEEGILGGEVLVVDSHAKYPHVVYRPAGWEGDLPLSRTSSMVSELASVVLYLRYVLRPADLLIIDEPEAHLHPGSQAVLAREMIRWVRSGLRVVVTTHSDWFLEQVANRVGLAAVPEGRRTGIDEPDVALEADQVGVWLFGVDQERGGSFVDKLGLDSETGLYPADHDAVSEALYNEGARVISRSQGNAGE